MVDFIKLDWLDRFGEEAPSFHVEVRCRNYHWHSHEKWFVSGWYEDEKAMYDVAEAAWEARQQEEWNQNPQMALSLNEDGSATLNLDVYGGDDYFRWNVVTPHWYLHRDGRWLKLLVNEVHEITGEFGSKELAESAVALYLARPDRFEGYAEHLKNAPPPSGFGEARL